MDSDKKIIHSDFYLIWNLIKELGIYLLLLIPYLCALVWYILTNSEKKSTYFSKVFLEPFKIIHQIFEWIFESKHTFILVLLLWFSYIIQIVFLPNFGDAFATNPLHLFSFEFYTIITSIFLHGSLIHLLSNCFALFIFGRIVEKHIGAQIYMFFFFGGVIANIFSHLFSFILGDLFTSWGASGAIASIILLSILMQPFAFVGIIIPISLLGWLIIYTDIIGIFRTDSINQFAHLGGYFATFLLFAFIEKSHIEKMKKGLFINSIALLIFYVVFFIV